MALPDGDADKEHQTTERLQHASFFARSPAAALARRLYLRTLLGGSLATIILIFVVFSLFWGSLWHTPSHALEGWVVDFDGDVVGEAVLQALVSNGSTTGAKVSWTVMPAAHFPLGDVQVADAVREEHAWVAITINKDASGRLMRSLVTPNATYDGADAISVFAVEARNENAYRNIIRPYVQSTLDAILRTYAMQTASQNITSLDVLSISPQTVVLPVSYRLVNLIPYNIPVASAVTFVGLILQLILTFFVVVSSSIITLARYPECNKLTATLVCQMMNASARTVSGLDRTLSTRSLIVLRMASTFTAFFVISLFYCLLSAAFQLPTDRKGLALESLVVLLTVRFIPFFMLTWVILNISVTIFPIEVLPRFFRYGYAAPFYNLSRAMRTIIFGTKNHVAFDFGVLLVWILISCTTLPLIQQWVRRRQPSSSPAVGVAPRSKCRNGDSAVD
ncbi:hypothetical protein D9619_013345 [Psilocybe cf. subviscida]|uniref:DUF3533 domain-containing protein n=1 Tax=Psilocybe cf. subviscida TaxID=2480587 RepID=A0A8H5F962_9AGAR|nr:hypothetical protein D9619_013345 [Psilocybe cf. subviscida]